MSLGAIHAGVEVVGAVEQDILAAQTYQNNFPETVVIPKDIREFDVDTFDNIELLFGGPPCQGFSTSNQRNRGRDNQNNWLFEEFFRVVEGVHPRWVVLENVKGILETERAFFFDSICERFRVLGYRIEHAVLNAVEYGIPQSRSRVFIVANRENRSFRFSPSRSTKLVTVRDAIADLPLLQNGARECVLPYRTAPTSDYASSLRNGTNGCPNNLVTRNNELVIERYQHVPPGGNWEAIPDELMTNYKNKSRCHTGIYRRLEWDAPSCVIGNYRKNMLIHPTQHRGLSVREAARLQSFPDNFEFSGTIGYQQQQVGNAVPPMLSRAVFEDLMRQQ